jgi:hypothetical protein
LLQALTGPERLMRLYMLAAIERDAGGLQVDEDERDQAWIQSSMAGMLSFPVASNSFVSIHCW